jgi:carbamoyl-phosphate synthase small subunit
MNGTRSTHSGAEVTIRAVAAGEPVPIRAAALVLADGSVFEGEAIGTGRIGRGEVVFNTALSGYQEIVTDPSYAGQLISFTYPHIGNYGTNPEDDESPRTFARGVIVRDLARRHSNYRASEHLSDFLLRHDLPGIAGIDTRRLTRLIRDTGAMPGALGAIEGPDATTVDALAAIAAGEPGTNGIDLVDQVTTAAPYRVGQRPGDGVRSIVAYDFGVKATILQHLGRFASVEVVPASTSAADVLARNPDGVFLSNGPGDPETVPYAVDAIKDLIGQTPVFGICLGHQLLSLAIGGSIEKLPFGHHGANHPVRDETTGKVEITSQNHNFAVTAESIAAVADVTHVNLNDGVCEGLSVRGELAFSVQHHPEASPGPHDSAYLFDRFDQLMNRATGSSNGAH